VRPETPRACAKQNLNFRGTYDFKKYMKLPRFWLDRIATAIASVEFAPVVQGALVGTSAHCGNLLLFLPISYISGNPNGAPI
jgi:hypothetical protein